MKSKINIVWALLGVLFVGCSNTAKIDRASAPKPGAAPTINIPKPVSFTLENGLKVFLVEDHKLPKVSFQLSVDTDPILEKGKVGLSDLTAELMGEGTTSRTKEEIDNEIDFIGASLSTYSGGVYVSSLTKHSDKVLEIASEIMTQPSFPEEQLEKKKRKLVSNLKSISTNPDAIADRVGRVVSYGKDHPYGEVQLKEHIDNITIEDCKQHYETYFRPNISYLVIVGDITVSSAKEKAQKYFGSWEKKEVPSHHYELPELVKENRVVFVEKSGAVQSLIQIIYPVEYKYGSEDASAVNLMTGIFGGAFSSYLNANLREDKGYTYGARGGIRPDRLIGKFTASASVRNEVTDSAIVEFLAEMNHIVTEEVSDEDLTRIRNNTNGNFALSLEKSQTIARFALNTAKYNLPENYYQNYLSRLDSVTKPAIQAAAKKYIKPNNCIILVVGNKDILPSLKQFDGNGIVEVLDMNGDPKKELKPITNGMNAEKVIEQYLYARTDLTNMEDVKSVFNKIKDIQIVMDATIQGMQINMLTKQMMPNLLQTEVKMNGNVMQKQVFDGEKGISQTPQGPKNIEGEELKALAQEAVMHKELKYEALGYQLNLLGIETVLGKEAYKVEVISPLNESEFQYFDVNSGLLIYKTAVSTRGGVSTVSTTEYYDYKKVEGILFPYKRVEQAGPQLIELNIKQLELNKGLKVDDFK
jgi:predicted Zn-dependent peptidase